MKKRGREAKRGAGYRQEAMPSALEEARDEGVVQDALPERGFDFPALEPRERYFLLTAIVVPRPIAWVSTLNEAGRRNLAPYSYFNACSGTPPIVHFTSTSPKDSIANVMRTGEFVINIVSHELKEAMRITSAALRPEEDEFKWAGLEAVPSTRVTPPRVAGAKVSLECRLRHILEMGEGTMAFGDVLYVHVSESVWRNGRVDSSLLRPVGRLSGLNYTTVTDVYRLDIPDWVKEVVSDYQVPGGSPG